MVAHFSRLRRVLERVYATRDLDRIDDFAAAGSPEFAQAARQIRFLRRHSLLDRTRTESRIDEVRVAATNEVEVVEKVVIHPRFIDDATGLEADLEVPTQRATLVWTIVKRGSEWRIYSAERASGM